MLPTLDIQYVKGVGPTRAALLQKELQVSTVGDLVRLVPYKYIDRTIVHRISDLVEDMPYVQLKGQIVDIEEEGMGRKMRLKAMFTDGTGYVELVWFNGIRIIKKNLRMDKTYLILGKPSVFNHRYSITHPEMDDADAPLVMERRMQAHYHTTEAMKRAFLSSRWMGETIQQVLAQLSPTDITDPLPEYIRQRFGLLDLHKALVTLHQPPSAADVSEATRRMKFEELFFLQLDIIRQGLSRKVSTRGLPCPRIGEQFNTFYFSHLPFPLTGAQKRVIHEIHADMKGGLQMNRLLQGDVGSGKTLVALFTCLIAIDNGYQAVLMAPTEILAEQHLITLRKFLEGMPGIRIDSSRVTSRARPAAPSWPTPPQARCTSSWAHTPSSSRRCNFGISDWPSWTSNTALA